MVHTHQNKIRNEEIIITGSCLSCSGRIIVEFKNCLGYMVSSRPARAAQNKQQKQTIKINIFEVEEEEERGEEGERTGRDTLVLGSRRG